MDNKIMYYIYHIPGKKVGVTRDLNSRVTQQQGYTPDEYEVLDHSTDIDYISKREIELQQSYGYKIDRKLYKNLFNNMKVNATEMTSTFPYPLNKLKGNLMDKLGESWETIYGTFTLNKKSVNWIIENAKTSMYDAKRSYIYNKAFFEQLLNDNKEFEAPNECNFNLPGKSLKEKMIKMLEKLYNEKIILDHGMVVGTELANVLSGGDTTIDKTISEDDFFNLELNSFMKLIETKETQERIKHTLATGKPLIN